MRQSGEESNPAPSQALKVTFQEAMANIIGVISPKRTVQPEHEPVPHVAKPEPADQNAGEPKTEELRLGDLGAKLLTSEDTGSRGLGGGEIRAFQPPAPYDIADAIADVVGAIGPRASRKPLVPGPAIEPVPEPRVPEPRNDWQPIATAPMDRAVQVGVPSRNGVLAVFFPCRLTADGWINALVRAPLLHDPTSWREWQDYDFDTD